MLTTISNLLTNRTYTISVLAHTQIGDGPLSEAIKVKTQQGGENINIIYISNHVTEVSYMSVVSSGGFVVGDVRLTSSHLMLCNF